jgi:capsular polysaccharide biosynthesis protein
MDQDYDLRAMLTAIRRFWWIALLTPGLILAALAIRNVTAPYQTSFRASVLLPGDTEVPGSSERPELMILDDLGPIISSQAFAQMVAENAGLPVDEVDGHLSVDRYSRIATITAKAVDRAASRQIADAASNVLATAVNSLMVAEGGEVATVQIIDPPRSTSRGDPNQWRTTGLATVVGLAIGCFLALVLDASLRPREFAEMRSP